MISEFADGGSLREHLVSYFDELTWKDKYKSGLDITNGLRYLHSQDIIHKDLYDDNFALHHGLLQYNFTVLIPILLLIQSSSNVLIHLRVAKITDFGLSTVLTQIMSKSRGRGNPAYRDPLSLKGVEYYSGK
jgi:serine/threonine protein kinase